MNTYKQLKGSINSRKHLFELVQYLTYFTLKVREKNPSKTTKDILTKWFLEQEQNITGATEDFLEGIDDLVMPFVLTEVWDKDSFCEMEDLDDAKKIKEKILEIITKHWFPF